MKVERGSFSMASASTATVILADTTLTPTEVTFFVGPVFGGSSVNQKCDGFMTATQQQTFSNYTDGTGSKSQNSNTKCIIHMQRVSGVITDKLVCNRPSSPFRAGEFDITCTVGDSNYIIYFIARGN